MEGHHPRFLHAQIAVRQQPGLNLQLPLLVELLARQLANPDRIVEQGSNHERDRRQDEQPLAQIPNEAHASASLKLDLHRLALDIVHFEIGQGLESEHAGQ